MAHFEASAAGCSVVHPDPLRLLSLELGTAPKTSDSREACPSAAPVQEDPESPQKGPSVGLSDSSEDEATDEDSPFSASEGEPEESRESEILRADSPRVFAAGRRRGPARCCGCRKKCSINKCKCFTLKRSVCTCCKPLAMSPGRCDVQEPYLSEKLREKGLERGHSASSSHQAAAEGGPPPPTAPTALQDRLRENLEFRVLLERTYQEATSFTGAIRLCSIPQGSLRRELAEELDAGSR